VVGPGDLELSPGGPHDHRQGALEQHVQAGRGLADAVDGGAGLVGGDLAPLGQPGQLVVAEALEQEQLGQLPRAKPPGHWASR